MRAQDSTSLSVRRYYVAVARMALGETWRLVWALSRGTLTVGIIGIVVAAVLSVWVLPWFFGWPPAEDAVSKVALGLATTFGSVAALFVVLFVVEFIRVPVQLRNAAIERTTATSPGVSLPSSTAGPVCGKDHGPLRYIWKPQPARLRFGTSVHFAPDADLVCQHCGTRYDLDSMPKREAYHE